MATDRFRDRIKNLLAEAGIHLNGKAPWDLNIHDSRFFNRVLAQGSLGFGESYMDGWWDCEALDEAICRILKAHLESRVKSFGVLLDALNARFFNRQSRRRAFVVGKKHYDLGNDLFLRMLDSRMIYSCGYWKDAADLDQAQENKLALVCRKLQLAPGQKVLDIGCGWGGTARYMAEHYDVAVTGITVSERQADFARQQCAGLPVDIRLLDYRDLRGQFDRIVSIGMFEHVGVKNYRAYFDTVTRCLHDDGLFLLHTIATNTPTLKTDPWIERYIFPNGMLPAASQITAAWEGLLTLEDWHSFGADYDPTLMAWHSNFNRAWPQLKENYDERFRRMWNFYLLSCAGAFRARDNQLWQIVLSKNGVPGGYQAPR